MAALGDIRGRALWVVVGCLVCQLGLSYGFMLGPLASAMIDELGWSKAGYGTARSVQLIGMSLATPVAGFALLRLGVRPVVSVATALIGGSVCAMGFVETLPQFMALTGVLGVGLAGIGDVTMGSVVARWIADGRGKALGFVYSGSNLGGFLFTPVAAWLASEVGWRATLWWIGGIGGLLVLPLGVLLVREPPRSPDAGGPEAPPESPPSTGRAAETGDEEALDLSAALRTRSFWILAFVLFAIFFFYLAMNTHMVLFLENVGLANREAAGWYSAAIAMGFATKLVTGVVADAVAPKSALALNQGLFALASLLAFGVPDSGFLQLFVITYGACTAARDVTIPLAVADCFGTRHLAEIYGVLSLTLLPGGFVGPVFAGQIADRTGSYDTAFLCFAILNVAALVCLAGLRREVAQRGGPGGLQTR